MTVTATDARNLTSNGSCTVNVEVPPPPPACSKANSIQFPDPKRPWRVDNTAKAILDDVASRLKADPNAKIVIVGYADGEKAPMVGTGKNRHAMNLAGQRAVNAKAYLVQQQGIDASRVEVRQGTGQQKVADIIWVPQGADENALCRSAEHHAGRRVSSEAERERLSETTGRRMRCVIIARRRATRSSNPCPAALTGVCSLSFSLGKLRPNACRMDDWRRDGYGSDD